jgi:hypothetical protein
MLIGKNWKIESDDLNVTLYNLRVNRKKDTSRWVAKYFFATVKEALKALVDMEIRGTGLKELEAVVKKIDELKAEIARLNI